MAPKCTQDGCSGGIEFGYCNICGAPENAPQAIPAAAAAAEAAPVSTKTGSNRLGSVPVGSSRTTGGSKPTRRLSPSTSRTSAPRLGAGLTTVPAAPVSDPRSVVMAVPEVPEEKRFCPACTAPVGRSRGDRPGRMEGHCPKCNTKYSFTPKLSAGDLVGGQYEVVGCLAHGGLGWIYLARDKNVSDRYVVLKGLLNSGDADAYAAAIAEQQFLAEVQHPLIVEIHNFVRHKGAGYIVMEYVGGPSLKSILKQRMKANGGVYDPVPLDQAIAYILEILPAFSYLHNQGLIYCDFKPDNVIQQGDQLKLIDLGGVRRADDSQSAIYGTKGFQAPEVPEIGPSVPGDIFTIGRTLAVLAMEFRGYQSVYEATLPPVEETPLFQRYDSLYRFLEKACAADPNDRFQSAEETREQLIGVLREVVALDATTRTAASIPSVLFEAPAITSDSLSWSDLPALKVNSADPMAAWLAGVSVADPQARLAALAAAPETTVEVRLAMLRAMIDGGQFDISRRGIDQVLAEDPWEWRAMWLSGLASLAAGDYTGAVAAFNTVYGQVPGELAPKLALAHACELAGNPAIAEELYTICARSDATYTAPAAFGLARIHSSAGSTDAALSSLDLVPQTSAGYVAARRQRATILASAQGDLNALAQAVDSIVGLTIDPRDRQNLMVAVLTSALEEVRRTGGNVNVQIAGVPAEERAIRASLEAAYRQLAAVTDDRVARVGYVDAANRVRPRTLV